MQQATRNHPHDAVHNIPHNKYASASKQAAEESERTRMPKHPMPDAMQKRDIDTRAAEKIRATKRHESGSTKDEKESFDTSGDIHEQFAQTQSLGSYDKKEKRAQPPVETRARAKMTEEEQQQVAQWSAMETPMGYQQPFQGAADEHDQSSQQQSSSDQWGSSGVGSQQHQGQQQSRSQFPDAQNPQSRTQFSDPQQQSRTQFSDSSSSQQKSSQQQSSSQQKQQQSDYLPMSERQPEKVRQQAQEKGEMKHQQGTSFQKQPLQQQKEEYQHAPSDETRQISKQHEQSSKTGQSQNRQKLEKNGEFEVMTPPRSKKEEAKDSAAAKRNDDAMCERPSRV